MPDQTVKVTFDETTNAFTFDPPSVSMTAAGKIVILKHPETANWTFVAVNELPSQFRPNVRGNGGSVDVDDGHTSNGSWHYTVTVHDQSGNHTSGDQPTQTSLPMIVNQ